MGNLWYCVAPFRQVFIDNNGVSACCQIPRQPGTLADWYASTELAQLQHQLLAGIKPSVCHRCVTQEAQTGNSLRIENNRDYNNEIFTDTVMNFIDYRASNICNFSCRSCGPDFSNKIARESEKSVKLQKFYQAKPDKVARVDEANFTYVIENLDSVDRLMFTGGEPTKMPEVKSMLTEVIKRAANRIGVLITTNGSFDDDFWYELSNRIPNLHWTLSLDAVGEAAEIIRHGTVWSQIEYNARWLATHAASFSVNTTVTNISLFQIKPLLRFVAELKANANGYNGCNHRFHISLRPFRLAADNLSPELLEQAKMYIQNCIDDGPWLDSQITVLNQLHNLLTSATFHPKLWSISQEFNEELDHLRHQSYQTLFTPSD